MTFYSIFNSSTVTIANTRTHWMRPSFSEVPIQYEWLNIAGNELILQHGYCISAINVSRETNGRLESELFKLVRLHNFHMLVSERFINFLKSPTFCKNIPVEAVDVFVKRTKFCYRLVWKLPHWRQWITHIILVLPFLSLFLQMRLQKKYSFPCPHR